MFNCNKIQYPKEVASVIFWKHLSLPSLFIFVKSESKRERERASRKTRAQEVLGFKKPKSKVRAYNLSDFVF